MDDETLKRKAAARGLSTLATDHPADLRQALDNGATLAAKLPRDLHWAEEVAHTFDLTPRRQEKA